MKTQMQGTKGTRRITHSGSRITSRMLIASLLVVMTAVRLGGGVAAASPEMCGVAAATLEEARSDYAAACEAPRVDCDKIDGLWYCSDQIIGERAPGGLTADNPITPPLPSSTAEPIVDVPAEQPGPPIEMPGCTAADESLNEAKSKYAAICEAPRVDCDKIDGLWYCSDQVIGDAAPGGRTGQPSEPPTPTPQPPAPTPQPPTLPDGLHPDIVDVIDVDGRNPGGLGWADSYSVGDQCFCATTFDHNIGGIQVDTPDGPKTVRQVCSDLGPGPGIMGRPIYNDVQCGNGPANDAGDEDDCPGRVDIGREGCGQIGPRWDLSLYE